MKKEDLINSEFEKVFKDFYYPFSTSDMEINKMSLATRKQYYKSAMELLKNPVYLQEVNEVCRSLYFKLAVDVEDKENRLMYKGALLFASKFVERIKNLTHGTIKSDAINNEINSFLLDNEQE